MNLASYVTFEIRSHFSRSFSQFFDASSTDFRNAV